MLRVGGLASGMDIDSIVKNMMKVERMPLDKLKQKKQILEWQRDDFRALNTSLLSFRDQLSSLRLTTSYRSRTASTTDEAKITATASSGASQASYEISQVTQLATAATRINNGGISKVSDNPEEKLPRMDPGKSIFSQERLFGASNEEGKLNWRSGVVETKTVRMDNNSTTLKIEELQSGNLADHAALNIKVNGKAFKVIQDGTPGKGEVTLASDGLLTFGEEITKNSSVKVDYVIPEKTFTQTISSDQKTFNLGKGSVAGLNVTLNGTTYSMGDIDEDGFAQIENLGKVNVATGVIAFNEGMITEDDTEIMVEFKQNFTSFSIGSHTSNGEIQEQIFVLNHDSLNSVIRKVNESSAGVTMFYDSFSDQMTLTRKETGNFNQNEADNGGNEIFFDGDFIKQVLNFEDSTETGGQNAKFTINGLETERSSNTFTMNGVTFTIKQAFTEPATVTVSNDSESVFDTIKDFVTKYNELIDEMNKKLNEDRNRSYQPLTDDDRESLTEKQQEQWEELAKSGLLKGDPILSGILSQMRIDMSSSVETDGLYKQLAAIGITTTSNYRDGGKLEINETKLKEALNTDPDAVEALFRGSGTTDSNRGVVHKLYDSVTQAMNRIYDKAGRSTATNQQFALGRELLDVDKSIDRFEDRLKAVEDRYWRQFTAMEKAIQRANDQAMFLMSQFGGM